jgi:hypothetical protein
LGFLLDARIADRTICEWHRRQSGKQLDRDARLLSATLGLLFICLPPFWDSNYPIRVDRFASSAGRDRLETASRNFLEKMAVRAVDRG